MLSNVALATYVRNHMLTITEDIIAHTPGSRALDFHILLMARIGTGSITVTWTDDFNIQRLKLMTLARPSCGGERGDEQGNELNRGYDFTPF